MKKITWIIVLIFIIIGMSVYFFRTYSVTNDNVNEKIEKDLNINEVTILNQKDFESYHIVFFDSEEGQTGIYLFKKGLFNRLKPISAHYNSSAEVRIQPLKGTMVVVASKNPDKEVKTVEIIYGKTLEQKEVTSNFLVIFDIDAQDKPQNLNITLYGTNNKILLERETVY